MTRHLTVEQALRIARTAVGGPVEIRDVGLLEAAVHRPRASRPRAGRVSRTCSPRPRRFCIRWSAITRSSTATSASAWLATYVFCAKNGVELDPDDGAAYDLVMAVASGSLDDLAAIAATLKSFA